MTKKARDTPGLLGSVKGYGVGVSLVNEPEGSVLVAPHAAMLTKLVGVP